MNKINPILPRCLRETGVVGPVQYARSKPFLPVPLQDFNTTSGSYRSTLSQGLLASQNVDGDTLDLSRNLPIRGGECI